MNKQLHIQDSATFDYLLESANKCVRGEYWKSPVANFYMNRVKRVMKLADCNHQYKQGRVFKIFSPKERMIRSECFEDRVYERSFNDNVLYPIMSKSFIKGNTACQKNKGNKFALDLLKKYLWNFYSNYSVTGYGLQLDIHKYYPTMSHKIAENMYQKKLNTADFTATKAILNSQSNNDVGFEAGNQTIQITGISLLSSLDHYIKEILGIKYYIRHMDDFIILHQSKSYIKYCFFKIEEQLKKLGFTLNPTKSHYFPISQKFCFLGYNFKLSKTGKIFITPKSQTIRRQKRHLKNLFKAKIPIQEIEQSMTSMLSHISYGNSYNATRNFKKYFVKLIKENKNEYQNQS